MLVCLAALLAPAGAASAAEPPPGPRLAVVVFRPYPHLSSEIETVGPSGEAPARIAGGASIGTVGPVAEDRPAWSPDGGRVAFFTGAGRSPFHVVEVSGGPAEPVPGLRRLLTQGSPVFTPDGKRLVFVRLQKVSGVFERPARARRKPLDVRFAIWSVKVGGGGLRAVTPWTRKRLLTPISFSPDGRYLAASEQDRKGERAVALDLRTGRTKLIAANATEPEYAPDGRVVSVRHHVGPGQEPFEESSIGSSDLLVSARPGAPARKVLSVKGALAWPSWDPSGGRIAFTTLDGSFGDLLLGRANSVMEVNADGTCPTTLLKLKRTTFAGVSWQPGEDRGAGPIAC
jgi:Tol biopolymer transport system component